VFRCQHNDAGVQRHGAARYSGQRHSRGRVLYRARDVRMGCYMCSRAAVRGHHGRAVQVDPKLTRVDRAWFRRLKLKCDETLSNFAFKFNLRRYIVHAPLDADTEAGPGRSCSSRHPAHVEPSFLELNCIL